MNKGHTALHLAAQNGHTITCELIATNGGDVHAKDFWGYTPLHRAAHNNHNETIEALMTHGSDVTSADKFEFTALQRAAQRGHRESTELLTSHAVVKMRRYSSYNSPKNRHVHFEKADSDCDTCRTMGLYTITEDSEEDESRGKIRRQRLQTM
ncbi:hypothetical protein OS493_030140 [Desmophyllum pertusum]|uniref:Ankyrin repeat protein n=1 Tax=Desmophyllum pertusum TaxID=174260 RepID=A0A9X0CPL0_9CNID|nr:hypothetical protein OS493_030140 [Desmophyllum pertusum]